MKSKPKLWRGRKVYYSGKYPEVYWPEHPCSRSAGVVRIHRIVAYESNGNKLGKGAVVHHVDENPLNWNASNLEITTNSEHSRQHQQKYETVNVSCFHCGKIVERTSKPTKHNQYCSAKCGSAGQERAEWPNDEELGKLVWEKPAVHIAKNLGVSDTAIRHRCVRRGIQLPPPYYWSGKRTRP